MVYTQTHTHPPTTGTEEAGDLLQSKMWNCSPSPWRWLTPCPLLLSYLLQAVEHRDEEAHVRQPLVVQVPDPLHQFWGWWHFRGRQRKAELR